MHLDHVIPPPFVIPIFKIAISLAVAMLLAPELALAQALPDPLPVSDDANAILYVSAGYMSFIVVGTFVMAALTGIAIRAFRNEDAA